MLDIEWILTEDVIVAKHDGDKYTVIERGEDVKRSCEISTSPDGRMLFDGEDVETEDFMVYVGMLDAVDDDPRQMAIFVGDEKL